MPTLSVYRHGSTMGAGNPNAVAPVRTEVQGWSAHAIRRNILFLYSVDERALEGLHGHSFTLTVRDCPETPEAWQIARHALLVALRRSGAVLVHWVTEWQRRGVPHLHLACYWSDPFNPSEIVRHWLRIAAPYRPRRQGQYHHRIYDVLGWNQYVSKHAARGLHHYQRSPENIPALWREQSTGRMWGKLGKWPVVDPSKLDLDMSSWWRLRRVVRGWRLADARKPADPNPRRVRSARRMLSCPDKRLSPVRGISEWMPQDTMLRVVFWLSGIDGAKVESV